MQLLSLQKSYFLIFLILFSFKLSAQSLEKDTIKMQEVSIFKNGKTESINWKAISLNEALEKAKAENKHILIYFTAKWCGPCLKMQQEVFPNREVIKAVNDNYIAVKIDIDAWGGKKWRQDFAGNGVPDFFILNNSGQRLRHNLAALETKQFLEFLNLKESPSNLKVLDTTHAKIRNEKWKARFNLGFGAGISNLTNSTYNNIFGYEVKLGYSIEKKRVFFSPGISFTSIGSSASRLNYIKIPAQVSLNFYRGMIAGVPGGYRILAAPYYGRLLNNPALVTNKNDIGLDYGIGIYMGDVGSASLEFAIKGSQGFTDTLPQSGKQANQFFRVSVTLSVSK
jgi:thioredoxin-related protein